MKVFDDGIPFENDVAIKLPASIIYCIREQHTNRCYPDIQFLEVATNQKRIIEAKE